MGVRPAKALIGNAKQKPRSQAPPSLPLLAVRKSVLRSLAQPDTRVWLRKTTYCKRRKAGRGLGTRLKQTTGEGKNSPVETCKKAANSAKELFRAAYPG